MHHDLVSPIFFRIESAGPARILRLTSPDGINRLTRACVLALISAIAELKCEGKEQIFPLVITGNPHFFLGRRRP